MKVLILDDHPLVLRSFSDALTARGHQVASARNLAEARVAAKVRQDVWLLDYSLPEGYGTDLLRVPGMKPPGRVAVLSGTSDPEDILTMLEQGAHAFLPKSAEFESLIEAIDQLPGLDETLLAGAVWDVAERCFVAFESAFSGVQLLTAREREVFMLMRAGYLDKRIAEELGTSINTVRVHIRSIRRKRGHTRRAERKDW